jgi:8-oxo-dGTP pyrophosphatase MutT (NUDIX family)
MGESPLQTARREFREEVEANAYNVQSYNLWTPSMEITGRTKKGRPHYLFVFVLGTPPIITGVQEEELQGWDWVTPSEAVRRDDLHHGVEGNLYEMIENPRLFTR